MTGSEHDDVLHLNDPQAIRAYAHRTRMALVGLLRTDGPLTATRAAELTGESVASCSYHLRMLAKYGVVEEVEGPGRQKPWRATTQFTNISRVSGDPAVDAAATELRVFLAQQYFQDVLHAERNWDRLPKEWQEAEAFGDQLLYLTPAELSELTHGIDELLSRFFDRNTAPELRPEGAELVQVLRIAFRKDLRPAAEDFGSSDSSPSPNSDSDSDPSPNSDPDSGPDSASSPDSGPGPDSASSPDPDPDPDSDSNPDSDPDPDSDSNPDSDPDPSPNSDSDSDPGSGSGSDASPDSDPDPDPDSGPGPGSGPDPDSASSPDSDSAGGPS